MFARPIPGPVWRPGTCDVSLCLCVSVCVALPSFLCRVRPFCIAWLCAPPTYPQTNVVMLREVDLAAVAKTYGAQYRVVLNVGEAVVSVLAASMFNQFGLNIAWCVAGGPGVVCVCGGGGCVH